MYRVITEEADPDDIRTRLLDRGGGFPDAAVDVGTTGGGTCKLSPLPLAARTTDCSSTRVRLVVEGRLTTKLYALLSLAVFVSMLFLKGANKLAFSHHINLRAI